MPMKEPPTGDARIYFTIMGGSVLLCFALLLHLWRGHGNPLVTLAISLRQVLLNTYQAWNQPIADQ